MKASFICPSRNKAPFVERAVRSMLAQDYTGEMEIVVSVQPSEDDTLAVVRDTVAGYAGPHEVRVLECPVADYRGMAGLNQHFDWLHHHLRGDVVINCSADDYAEPGEVSALMDVFERYNPSYAGVRMIVEKPDGEVVGLTDFPGRKSGHVGMVDLINYSVGASGSSAWARDLWRRYGPLTGVEAQDMMLPILAFFERGYYFVDEPLHHHVLHAGADNTGTEGQMRASTSPEETAQLCEMNAFMGVNHWTSAYRRILQYGYQSRMTNEVLGAFWERIINSADHWALHRSNITMQRLEPRGYRV